MENINRREFLKFISSQSIALGLSPLLLSHCTTIEEKDWQPLSPTNVDALVLASGFSFHIIAQYGDIINSRQEAFGFNNDFTCFHPLNENGNEGLLWVNHEYPIPELIHNLETSKLTRSKKEIRTEQLTIGGSILHIKKNNENKWKIVNNSNYNRRLSATTPIPFSQQQSIQGKKIAIGTLANCAGGYTPWKTFLTSEENYDDFYGEAYIEKGRRVIRYRNHFDWYKQFPYPPEHYGWVVEVDPLTGKAEKQINLGRAPHEGATVVTTKDNKAVVYMGEDREGGFIYKFVSDGLHFKSGTLYAADTINGKWLPLDIAKDKKLSQIFKTQLDVLTYSHQAAKTVGATPQDRPEDIEVHPQTGDIFIALTKNLKRNNPYGSLLKISEKGDFDSEEFNNSTWLSGGLDVGVACPDNLCFDKKGNLWFTNDISEKEIESGPYKGLGNNGLFYVATSGPEAGLIKQVASAPVDAELTGPYFSEDQKTLFLSVQHPGAETRKNLKNPTSHWPNGEGHMPKSAVVAIQGPTLSRLTQY